MSVADLEVRDVLAACMYVSDTLFVSLDMVIVGGGMVVALAHLTPWGTFAECNCLCILHARIEVHSQDYNDDACTKLQVHSAPPTCAFHAGYLQNLEGVNRSIWGHPCL
jgi:hypothetical protein